MKELQAGWLSSPCTLAPSSIFMRRPLRAQPLVLYCFSSGFIRREVELEIVFLICWAFENERFPISSASADHFCPSSDPGATMWSYFELYCVLCSWPLRQLKIQISPLKKQNRFFYGFKKRIQRKCHLLLVLNVANSTKTTQDVSGWLCVHRLGDRLNRMMCRSRRRGQFCWPS